MSKELKDCPFCGSLNLHSTGNGIGNEFIECADCGASGPVSDHAADFDDLWNRRAALATPPVASGALPELPERDGVININVYTDEDAWNADSMRLYGQACAAAAAPNAAPDLRNVDEVIRMSDQSVRVRFASCRAASEFEQYLRAALAQAGAA